MSEQHRLVIVSHDAGGAEILSSYVRRNKLNPLYVLEGPSRKIFERKVGVIQTLPLEQALLQASSILCSTSWQSDLEFNAIKLAKKLGKPSVAFLDHWVNYPERFTRKGETCLPNEIWVGDTIAKKMAERVFPYQSVCLKENPYFLDVLDEIELIDHPRRNISDGISILYVCEPLREHAKLRYGNERYWGYVEEDALRYFLSNISIFGRTVKCVQIRPHPSEERDKYNWAKKEYSLPIVVSRDDTLLTKVMMSDVVVGCESMAMVIGLLAGKRVVSSIPPEGRECMLPHSKIEKLWEIVSDDNANI